MFGLAGLSWFWMCLVWGFSFYCLGFSWIVWFAAGFAMCVSVVFLVFRCLIAFGILGLLFSVGWGLLWVLVVWYCVSPPGCCGLLWVV